MTDEPHAEPDDSPAPSNLEKLPREAREASGDLVSVYTLRHPETGAVGYIGASPKPREQLSRQLYDARAREIGPLYDWLRELLFAGLRPTVTLVREVPKDQAKAQLSVFKTLIGYTDPPKRPRGKALRYPHDLVRFTPVVPEDFHYRGRTTPDQRDPYVGFLKRRLREYGPKLKSTGSTKITIPANTPEMRELARKTARMILKSKT